MGIIYCNKFKTSIDMHENNAVGIVMLVTNRTDIKEDKKHEGNAIKYGTKHYIKITSW